VFALPFVRVVGGRALVCQVLNSFIECARLHSSKTARAIADTEPDNSGEHVKAQ